MNLSLTALKRPVTTIMVFISLIVLGSIASTLLPLDFLPDMDFPSMSISIPYANSTPKEVEESITRPVEEVLGTMSGIKRLVSTSDETGSQINIQYEWGEDLSIKSLEAKEKIESIWNDLPSDLQRFFVFKFSSSDIPIMNLRLSSDRDLSNSYDLLDRNLKRPLERIPGISKVQMHGVEKNEVMIELKSDRILAHRINIGELQRRLVTANLSVNAGRITDGGKRYSVRPLVEFQDLQDIENLLINERGLRLKDIATVRYEQPERNYGRHLDGNYAIGLEIQKEAGANTVEVAERILATIQEISNNNAMTGIRIIFLDNAAEGIQSSIDELLKSGMWGALFAVLVLYFFLRKISTTLIVGLAIPLSLLITLGFMYVTGMTLNILTMMGLMLSVGMLVDNAVVVTESIYRHQQLGEDSETATSLGIKEVGLAVAAATSTTAIVFLPFIMAPEGEIAIYMKHISLTIVIALATSLLIAQTLIPLLTSKIKFRRQSSSVASSKRQGKAVIRYEASLKWTLAHPGYTSLIVLGILVSTALPIANMKLDMFPDREDRRLRLQYHINDSYRVEKVEEVVDQIEAYLFANQEEFDIKSVYTYYQNGYAMSTLILNEQDDARKSEAEVAREITAGLPKIAMGNPSFSSNDNSASGQSESIGVQLWGDSSELLAELSHDLEWRLAQIPGLKDVRSSAGTGERELHVKVRREQAGLHDFSAQGVGQVVSVALRGQALRRFKTPNGEVDMKLRLQDSDRESLHQLKRLVLYDNANRPVQLGTLADFTWNRGPQQIRRIDRQTAMSVTATLDEDFTVGDAKKEIRKHLANYELPPGYTWSFGGRFQREDETLQIMLVNLALAMILIYFVMAALFESLIYPAAIWSSILFAFIGTFWFFWMTGTTFSMMAIIGVFVLIGIVVNNGIVLIDHINQLRASGLSRNDAIVKGGLDRVRPILMTAGTTVLGLIPLSIGNTLIGGDGPPYFPMARAIMGGLIFSTGITLIILPSIYVGMDNLKLWGQALMQQARGDGKAEIASGVAVTIDK